MDGVCLSELPEDVGVDNPVGLKQGVIRTLLMTHDIRGLRSIGKGGAGQGSSLRSLPCHKLRECLVVFIKPCTVLDPANKTHFFGTIVYSKLLIILAKNHQR